MKYALTAATAALLMASSTHGLAASSVDLSVKGTITPSACTPVLSQGGVVDHGKISISDLKSSRNLLRPVTVQLAVNCDGATLMAFKSTDNREGTADHLGLVFGLGMSGDGQKLGYYELKTANTLADGEAVPVVESPDGVSWQGIVGDQIWQPGWMRSVSRNADSTPVAVQSLTTDVIVQTTLSRPKIGTEDIPLDGSATLDIVYL
ncbi:DUF1120 domain-containing protein [Pseudomonas sp. SDO528_S397]